VSLFAIGDLHLSFGVPQKPMDIFKGWDNYQTLIEKNWLEKIQPKDTVVLAGDISWGMSLEQADADFRFIDNLPGRKIILKGNHDYWWTTVSKMKKFFDEKGYSTLSILHNNYYEYENYAICGSRGWVNMPNEPADAKVIAREAQRLDFSLVSAKKSGLERLVFMHYPPVFAGNYNYSILDVLLKHDVKKCFYGHVHGKGHAYSVQGQYDGVEYTMISSDFLHFIPYKIF